MQHNNYTDVTGLTLAQLHYRAPTKDTKQHDEPDNDE
jgi:hypothetical protein